MNDKLPPQTALQACLQSLSRQLKADQLQTDPATCLSYGYDNSRKQYIADAVCFPSSHGETATVLRICNEHHIPVTTRGLGTGTAGGALPIHRGVVLSTERLNRIIEVDPANRLLVAEPGVTNLQIQQAALEHGFFWAPDPSSSNYCTLGGNLAYNSAGPRAVKYGTPRENTLGLKAVLADGRTIQAGCYTTKGVVGYDLTRLLIGSEGTLAVITEATLKLIPLAEAKRTFSAWYADISSATLAITEIMSQPILPCALEFIDNNALQLLREHTSLNIPLKAKALLIIEVDGPESAMQEATKAIQAATQNPDMILFQTAGTPSAVASIWQARKELSPTLRHVAPKKINEDIAVPVSNIPNFMSQLDILAEQHKIHIVTFGHAGNGNLHVNLLINPDNKDESQRAQCCLSDLFDTVIRLNGTLSGEHGVGTEKVAFIDREIDPVTLELMRAIKREFDPRNILNPGKTLPAK